MGQGFDELCACGHKFEVHSETGMCRCAMFQCDCQGFETPLAAGSKDGRGCNSKSLAGHACINAVIGHPGYHQSLDGTTWATHNAAIPGKLPHTTGTVKLEDNSDGAFKTEGRKFDQQKPRWDLLPWKATAKVVDVLTYGSVKYAPENWRKVDGWRWRYHAAALRHLAAWATGEANDAESGQ